MIACVGGGSNAIGLFHPFIGDASVAIIGIEAGGRGAGLGENAAPLSYGRPGVLHGSYSMLLQDEDGQIQETHSVSAGLDYPGVGPEHALLLQIGRVRYEAASDDEALDAVRECCECEGILPAIESAHALAGARRWARQHPGERMLIGLSGRGDKDMPTLQARRCSAAARHGLMRRTSASPRRIRGAGARGGEPALVAFLTAGYPQPRAVSRAPGRDRRRGRRGRDRRAVHAIRWPTA